MAMNTIKLNDHNTIPQLGFGVWQVEDKDAPEIVSKALETGYRHIDTAKIYGNEEGVGKAIAASSLPREDLFITTKLWHDEMGYDATMKGFEASLKRLGLDYLDLYLIHWPAPAKDQFVETWKAFIELHRQGLVRSIGVCNFRIVDLERIIKETGVAPVVNQIELHPLFQQQALRAFHQKHNIATEAWSPLGRGQILENSVLNDIAAQHGKTTAQIILRWHMEIGNIAIPKTVNQQRMVENMDIFDFSLNANDHNRITALDSAAGRTGPDPDSFPA